MRLGECTVGLGFVAARVTHSRAGAAYARTVAADPRIGVVVGVPMRAMRPGTDTAWLSAALNHVVHIVLSAAFSEMSRVATRRVVARVEH